MIAGPGFVKQAKNTAFAAGLENTWRRNVRKGVPRRRNPTSMPWERRFWNSPRRFLAGEPVTARPPSVVRRIGLWSRRNPSACLGAVCAIIGLVGFIVALTVGYVHTRQALAETERARKETQQALLKVEEEAGRAAQSLATTLSVRDRPKGDFRADEIARALATVEALAERFPDNAEVKSALGKLRYAKEAHARVKARRGGGR